MQNPSQFGVEDWKIPVDMAEMADIAQDLAPTNHPVMQLVPPEFDRIACEIFQSQEPGTLIDRTNAWRVFRKVKEGFITRCVGEDIQSINNILGLGLAGDDQDIGNEVRLFSLPFPTHLTI